MATDDAASPSAYHSVTTSQMTANAAHGCAFKAAFSLCGLRKNGKTVEQPFVVDHAAASTALLGTGKRNTRFQLPVGQAILY